MPTPAFARGRLYVGMTNRASRVRQAFRYLVLQGWEAVVAGKVDFPMAFTSAGQVVTA
jgi:hypothetical protein